MPESNRSLERGLAVLDCFKPGVAVLSHTELVEQTGLAKATVTRLTTALRRLGYMSYDAASRGFRLGAPVLSLARAHQMGHPFLARLSPVIRRLAKDTRTIVGVAEAHRADMVYLDQVNCDPTRATRHVGPGQRMPIASSAIGRGYLGGLAAGEQTEWLARFRAAGFPWSTGLEAEITRALAEVQRRGFCTIQWNEGRHAAVGAPLHAADGRLYAVNIGYALDVRGSRRVPDAVRDALGELLACGREPLRTD